MVLTGVFAVRVSYSHILTFWALRLRNSNIQAKFKVVKIDLAVDMLAPQDFLHQQRFNRWIFINPLII